MMVGVLIVALVLVVLAAVVMPAAMPRGSQMVRCISPRALTGDLVSNPVKRDMAQMLVGSAENSSLFWEDQVSYLEYNVEGSEEWNRGYTGGIIGFTSKTSSQLSLVERYTHDYPDNPLAPFLPTLRTVNGTSSKEGLAEPYEQAWARAAEDPAFLDAQRELAEEWYLAPALEMAQADQLRAFGQFAYYDAHIQHGTSGIDQIRTAALEQAEPPSAGGDETQWLQAWLDARYVYMTQEVSEGTATRVTTSQQGLLDTGNLDLRPPLTWEIYGDTFTIQVAPFCTGG